MKPLFYCLAICVAVTIFSCKKDGSKPTTTITLSSVKGIDSFSVKKADGGSFNASDIVVTITAGDTILVSLPPFIGSDDHNFYAVDSSSASVKWVFPAGGPTDSGPTVLNGIVYFAGGDGNLYALDAGTCAVDWQFNLNGVVSLAAPQLSNGVVYIGSRTDSLYAVDAVTGNFIWSAKTDGFTLEESSATVNNGVVYVGAESGSLFAFDATTGAQLWKSLVSASVYDQPFVFNNAIYVTADDGTLDAINAQTGATLWSVPAIYANGAGPIVANGVLFVGGGGSRYFYAFDPAAGSVKWKFNTGNSLVLSFRPLYVGGN
jgi:outer membrane protein assembly factor BamB